MDTDIKKAIGTLKQARQDPQMHINDVLEGMEQIRQKVEIYINEVKKLGCQEDKDFVDDAL